MRALLAARWIEIHGTAPPVPFAALVATTEGNLKKALEDLIAAKAVSGETDSQGKIALLDDYIAEAIEGKESSDDSGETDGEGINLILDREFRRIISPRRPVSLQREDFTLERVR